MAKPTKKPTSESLMVRLDHASKQAIVQAAALRKISVSDYVRTITVAQAQKEIESAKSQVILLSPDEQLAFWQALSDPKPLTKSQQKLGKIMRGEM